MRISAFTIAQAASALLPGTPDLKTVRASIQEYSAASGFYEMRVYIYFLSHVAVMETSEDELARDQEEFIERTVKPMVALLSEQSAKAVKVRKPTKLH